MFLLDGEDKFFLRGVSYGPFRSNAQGEPFPDKAVVTADFEQMRELGANGVRFYHVAPPWLVELAGELDLRLLVGVPWSQHVRFLDARADRAEIHRRIRDAAASLRDAPHLLGLLLGNEIPPAKSGAGSAGSSSDARAGAACGGGAASTSAPFSSDPRSRPGCCSFTARLLVGGRSSGRRDDGEHVGLANVPGHSSVSTF